MPTLIVGLFAVACTHQQGPTAPTVDDNAPAAMDSSEQRRALGESIEQTTNVDVHCDLFDDARIRFSEPGFINFNEVGMYVATRGMPEGDKRLRLWWDYDNAGDEFTDFILEDDVFEDTLEHEYTDLDAEAKKKVRIALTMEGSDGHCVRVRHIAVAPKPVSTEATTPGTPAPPPTPTFCGGDGVCTVFVTGIQFQGDLNGLNASNTRCQRIANGAGLSGTFKAWLATNASSPDTSFTKPNLPYKLVDGTLIANSYADLTDGTIAAPINRHQGGGLVSTSNVYTNVRTTGTKDSNFRHCRNWHSRAMTDTAIFGRTNETGAGWTRKSGHIRCDITARLYCFEQ